MKNVVAYCRVSTDETDQLHSLQTQKDFFTEYARKNGMNLVHVYSDEGISGTKTKNRTAFNQMMRDAERKIFEIVLIKDVSRLARNTVVLLESCRTLRALGIEVQFLNYQMNNMGSSEFLLTLYAAMAQEESYNTSKRIKFSKKFNAQRGKVPNIVFGYDKIKGDYFHLQINEKEAETVRLIFRKYTEDGDGTLKIAQMLNGMGITTKRGCKWTQNAVARILSNSIYIGKIVSGKQENVNFPDIVRKNNEEKDFIIVENESLRILDSAIFEKAKILLNERTHMFKTKQSRHSNKYLFSTLIKCADCGWSFRRIKRTYQNTYIKWVCSARNGHGKDSCKNAVSIDENLLIEALQKYFSSLLSNKEDYIEKAKEEFRKSHEETNDRQKQRINLEKKLSQLKQIKEKAMNLYMTNYLSFEEFQKKTADIQAEIPRLEQELQALSIAPNTKSFEKALDFVFQNIEQITDIRTLSNAELKKIIREIKVDKDGHIDIILNVLSNTQKAER